MVNLRKITSENVDDIYHLKADTKLVASNAVSMMEAYAYYVEHGEGPLAYGIYNDDMAVGFIMVKDYKDFMDDDGEEELEFVL